jgi:hypothetical protein
MGERGRVVLHVLGRGADRFRWGNVAGGEHFKELGTAWKKIIPALVLRSICVLENAVVNLKDKNYKRYVHHK